ncbi:MAG: hypothetical protein LR008_00735 [Candidatus Pacebacteria bacterium]|nr:hypothetical protein [Candidatus Paceibacterota bacterium]
MIKFIYAFIFFAITGCSSADVKSEHQIVVNSDSMVRLSMMKEPEPLDLTIWEETMRVNCRNLVAVERVKHSATGDVYSTKFEVEGRHIMSARFTETNTLEALTYL